MRTIFSIGSTMILPSPTSPVRAPRQDRVDGRLHEVVRDADLEAHLLGERHLHARAAVVLDVLHLAAVALHAADRQAAHLGVKQRLEHVAQLLGPDDRDDEFHNPPSRDFKPPPL